jgi:hypothetical protein
MTPITAGGPQPGDDRAQPDAPFAKTGESTLRLVAEIDSDIRGALWPSDAGLRVW